MKGQSKMELIYDAGNKRAVYFDGREYIVIQFPSGFNDGSKVLYRGMDKRKAIAIADQK